MKTSYLIFLGICILNPLILNLGMGLQKLSIDRIGKLKRGSGKSGWMVIWTVGMIFVFAPGIIGFKALSLGNASTLAGFAGLGLIFLTLFSYFVLKEEISRKELYGMILIVIGTSLLGYFSGESQNPKVTLETQKLIIFFAIYLGAIFIGIFMLIKNLQSFGGAILGMIGGSLNGVGLTFQKIVTPMFMGIRFNDGSTIIKFLSNPYTWLMIIGGIGGVIVIQFGYKYGKAIQVVPGHAATVIIIPAIAGMIVLGEIIPVVCLISILIVTVGVIITTTAAPFKHK